MIIEYVYSLPFLAFFTLSSSLALFSPNMPNQEVERKIRLTQCHVYPAIRGRRETGEDRKGEAVDRKRRGKCRKREGKTKEAEFGRMEE
jgi:hypothetical protein